MSSRVSTAARVAGALIALGYATGLVDGPLFGALAGLALVTLGRSLIAGAGTELLGPLALAVCAGAAGVVALRWGTLSLVEIQGSQGVLGPTIGVEPVTVAVACAVALTAATLALGISATEPSEISPVVTIGELLPGGVLLASLFVGPPPSDPLRAASWLGAMAAATGLSWFVARSTSSRSVRFRTLVLLAGAVVVTAAAILVRTAT